MRAFLDSFFDSFAQNNVDTKSIGKEYNKHISRITVHVSNDCNLRCKYCYAQGGHYGGERILMAANTAEMFVDFCVKEFDKINRIVFFGGEPLLNPKIIDIICARFKQYKAQNKISYIPLFVIVTNGTVLSDEIIDLIQRHIDLVCVSIDGEKEFHDSNRVFKDGTGSFEKVSDFITAVQRKTVKSLQYEATYTKTHIDSDYQRETVMEFLKKQFGIDGAVVDEEGLGYDPLLEYWNKMLELEDDNILFEFLPEDFYHIFTKLLNNKDNYFCPVAKRTFAVNCNGDIYACHLLNGKGHDSLGNIQSKNIFNTPTSYASFYQKKSFKNTMECEQCWAHRLCGGCTVNGFYDEKNQEFTEKPNVDRCDFMRKYLEKIIAFIVRIRKKPMLWNRLIQLSQAYN